MDTPAILFRFPGIEGVHCAFLTRAAGNISLETACQPDRENTALRRAALGPALGFRAFAEARQVHGVTTRFDPAPQPADEAPAPEADGLATELPDLALMIKTADCQPILVAHRGGRHILALHTGWRGNRQRYPVLAIAAFCERYGLRPEDLSAVRGPSLGPDAAEFVHFEEEWGDPFLPWFNPARRTMDLWRLTRDQLVEAGLRPERIYGLDLCTWSLPESFFSFRRYRHGSDTGPDANGRQASLIWRDQRPASSAAL